MTATPKVPAQHKNIDAALFALQGEVPVISTNSTNDATLSRFASLDHIMETVLPLLQRHGILWRCSPRKGSSPLHVAVISRLSHVATGDFIEDEFELPVQLSGLVYDHTKLITYLRRYLLVSQLGLTFKNMSDDDAASNHAIAASADTASAPGKAPRGKASTRQLPPRVTLDDPTADFRVPGTDEVITVSSRAVAYFYAILKNRPKPDPDNCRAMVHQLFGEDCPEMRVVDRVIQYRLKHGHTDSPETLCAADKNL